MFKFIVFSTLFIVSLFLYQKISTLLDDMRHSPKGELVDIGGYKLHLNATGEGGPSVVLDAGLSGTSLGWTLVQSEVSKWTRVCSFDRAGYSWSDPSPLRRTSINMAQELHTLLKKAHIRPPYLLVGHSFGGCNALLFAHLYPEETFGVVLVDSVHEDLLKEFPEASRTNKYSEWCQAAIGLKRLRGPSKEIVEMFRPLPKEVSRAYIAQMNKTNYVKTIAKETELLSESLAELEKSQVHLGDRPLIVISAGEGGEEWQRLQKRLLTKSNRPQHIIAEKSDHMINHHQPEIISSAIRSLIVSNF